MATDRHSPESLNWRNRNIVNRLSATGKGAAAAWMLAMLFIAPPAAAQNYGTAQTNLAPIGVPQAYGAPPATLFDPYASGSRDAANVVLATPQATAAAPTGGNPAYPGGSLLGGLFSGSAFNRRPAATAPGYPAYPSAPGNIVAASPWSPAGSPAFGTPSIGTSAFGNSGIAPYPPTPPDVRYGPPIAYGGGGSPSAGYGPPPGSLPNVGPTYLPPPPEAYGGTTPSSLFPGGLFGSGQMFPGQTAYAPTPSLFNLHQFLHAPRIRHGYFTGGGGKDSVDFHKTDVSAAFAFPNFLWSTRPVYVVPSFSLYLFDGPISGDADLPGQTYGAFLDVGWQSDPQQMFGTEFGVRTGVFSDFDTFNDDSVRVLGKGLASFRLTPRATLKAGAYYYDRLETKVLPAGGLLLQLNPLSRLDLFFPEPKFASYLTTLGTQDFWWYVGGTYGVDSWTITRRTGPETGLEERFDLNQIELMVGLEWGRTDRLRTGQRTGFIEAGVALDRQVEYEFSDDDFKADEAFLVRAGIGY